MMLMLDCRTVISTGAILIRVRAMAMTGDTMKETVIEKLDVEGVEEETVEEAVKVFKAEEEGDVAEEVVHVHVDEDVEVLPHLRSTRSALWMTKTEQCRVCLLIFSLFDPRGFTYQLVSTFLQSWTFFSCFSEIKCSPELRMQQIDMYGQKFQAVRPIPMKLVVGMRHPLKRSASFGRVALYEFGEDAKSGGLFPNQVSIPWVMGKIIHSLLHMISRARYISAHQCA